MIIASLNKIEKLACIWKRFEINANLYIFSVSIQFADLFPSSSFHRGTASLPVQTRVKFVQVVFVVNQPLFRNTTRTDAASLQHIKHILN